MSELRSAAVMFADIAAATALRNRVGDREADAILDPLLQKLTQIIEIHGGAVLKSDGDDVLAVFDRQDSYIADCVNAAIECQQTAHADTRKLYVGVDAGEVEFRTVLGRPDVAGMAVNMAARLHKLVPDLPGQIFLTAETVGTLPEDLRERTRPYGARPIKGVGQVEVHTLDWDEAVTVVPTRFSASFVSAAPTPPLVLIRDGHHVELDPDAPPIQLGRDRRSDIRVEDAEQFVSSKHLKISCRNGDWLVQDISRNGTWVRFDNNEKEIALLGDELKIVGNGMVCLGRPFADDPEGRFTLEFSLASA